MQCNEAAGWLYPATIVAHGDDAQLTVHHQVGAQYTHRQPPELCHMPHCIIVLCLVCCCVTHFTIDEKLSSRMTISAASFATSVLSVIHI